MLRMIAMGGSLTAHVIGMLLMFMGRDVHIEPDESGKKVATEAIIVAREQSDGPADKPKEQAPPPATPQNPFRSSEESPTPISYAASKGTEPEVEATDSESKSAADKALTSATANAAAVNAANASRAASAPGAAMPIFGQHGAANLDGFKAPRLSVKMDNNTTMLSLLELKAACVVATFTDTDEQITLTQGTLANPLKFEPLLDLQQQLSDRSLPLPSDMRSRRLEELLAQWGDPSRVRLSLHFTNAFDQYLLEIQQRIVGHLPEADQVRARTVVTIQVQNDGIQATGYVE